jgi:hypothetical protein
MRFHPGLCVASLAVCLASTAVSRAEVYVRAPYVTVRVGQPGVYVNVMGWPVVSIGNFQPPGPPRPPRRISEAPRLREAADADEPVPALSRFADTFRPSPGRHKVTVVHPVTGRPVRVDFRLPDGKPRHVRVRGREVDFDYGNTEVAIRFLRNGKVRVLYD